MHSEMGHGLDNPGSHVGREGSNGPEKSGAPESVPVLEAEALPEGVLGNVSC